MFNLSENQTNLKTEVLAGVTTFLTMIYIVFLNPAILSRDFAGNPTGLDFGAVLLATCLGSALTTIFMGLYARYPLALAPGMGENFFFVSVILSLTSLNVPNAWQAALGIVFLSGLLFIILSVLHVREAVIDSVSPSLRAGIASGIGLFIAFIGLKNAGLVVAKAGTLIGLNARVLSPDIGLFLFGFVLTSILLIRRVPGAVLWGILTTASLAFGIGKIQFTGLFGLPHIQRAAAFRLDIHEALAWRCLPYVVVFLIMQIFDNVGTLIAVAEQAGFIKDNKLPRASRVLLVDSVGTTVGAVLGTSTITSYIESATGVASGGRTGLVSVITGFMLLTPLILGPLVESVAKCLPITAPALVVVGVMMMENVKKIDWRDYSESIPAFLILAGIPLSFSIADGLALGFVVYPPLKILSGRGKDIRWPMAAASVILLAYFAVVRARMG